MSDHIHIIVISSVLPEDTSAGSLVLYRHLKDQPGISFEVHCSEPRRFSFSTLFRRILARLGRTRFSRFAGDLWVILDGLWMDADLPQFIGNPEQTVVLTVAHGEAFMAAARFAKRHQVALASIYHDWWPEMAEIHPYMKKTLERKFLALARESSVVFCVCDGMQEELGDIGHTVLLPPCPGPDVHPHGHDQPQRGTDRPFRILYCGNLGEYGPMLSLALQESLGHPEILLQVRGSNPAWSPDFRLKMRQNGRWLQHAPRLELEAWLASADAFLVPMSFEVSLRKRMRTSFPSKLTEFARFLKPIVVWGPPDCSAHRWALRGNKALAVTDASSSILMDNILTLSSNDDLQQTLRKNLQEHITSEGGAEMIRNRFHSNLARVCSMTASARACCGRPRG